VDSRLAIELELFSLPDERFCQTVYRLALRRKPEPDVLADTVARLRDGTLSRAALIEDMITSQEFQRLRVLDDAVAFAAWARSAGERPRELSAPAGSDERPIELSWCLARYRGEPRVLDVGYAFAEPAHLVALTALGAARLVGIDLAEADVPGLESIRADLRDLPFKKRSFDVVFCISTIEHVGADNTRYGVEGPSGGMDQALRELCRVGGRTLVTVPCGESADYGWFVQDEPEGWRARFRAAGFFVFEDEVYELGPEGWRSASAFASGGVRYGERGPGASAVLCAELHPRALGVVLRHALRRMRRRIVPVSKTDNRILAYDEGAPE
jgi:SAM-dependent methyltransferase